MFRKKGHSSEEASASPCPRCGEPSVTTAAGMCSRCEDILARVEVDTAERLIREEQKNDPSTPRVPFVVVPPPGAIVLDHLALSSDPVHIQAAKEAAGGLKKQLQERAAFMGGRLILISPNMISITTSSTVNKVFVTAQGIVLQ